MYAIIEAAGKQFKVESGDEIYTEKLNLNEGDTVNFDKVLLVESEDTIFGTPFINGASVTAKVLKNGKQKKIIVMKFKAKKGYKRKQGHRQPYTKLLIESINI